MTRSKKIILSLLTICMAITACLGLTFAFAEDALTVKGVYYTSNYASFAGDCIYVDFGESLTTADWAGCTIDDKVVLRDENGNIQALQYLDTQGNNLLINRTKNVQYAVGWTLTIKNGFSIQHVDTKYTPDSVKGRTVQKDVSYEYAEGQTWVLTDKVFEEKPSEIAFPASFGENAWFGDTEVRIPTGFANQNKADLSPTSEAKAKVYVLRGETKYTCSHVYEWNGCLTFYFNGSGYTGQSAQNGDQLIVEAGFEITHNGINYICSAGATYTYNDSIWSLKGAQPAEATEAKILSAVTAATPYPAFPIRVDINTDVTVSLGGGDENLNYVAGTDSKITYTRGNASVKVGAMHAMGTIIRAYFKGTDALSLEQDAPERGDLIKVESGFGFSSKDQSVTYEVKADYTFIYDGIDWVAGTDLPEIEVKAAHVTKAEVKLGWSNASYPLIISLTTDIEGQTHASVGELLASALDKSKVLYRRDGKVVKAGYVYGAENNKIWAWFGSTDEVAIVQDTAEIGDVIELPAGFTFKTADQTRIYRFEEAISYVYDGTEWKEGSELPNQPTTFEIASTVKNQMYVGAIQEIKVTPTPATAIGAYRYSVSDEAIATITSKGVLTAKAAGTVTVTVRCNGVEKTLAITVVADEDAKESLEIVTDVPEYWVPVSTEEQETSFLLQGYTLKACYVFNDGLKSEPFDVTEEEIGALDYTTAGKKQLTVTDKETGFTATVPVNVYEYTQFGRFNSVGVGGYDINDKRNQSGTWNGHMIISMSSYSTNTVNMLSTAECGLMAPYIEYTTADGKTYLGSGDDRRLGIWLLGSNILVMIKPDGATGNIGYASEDQWKEDASYVYAPIYKLGDKITFKKGMPFYTWKGEGQPSEGKGCMIIEGYLYEDFTYICYEEDGTKSLWQIYKEYTDFTLSESVTVAVGKTLPVGAVRVPSDATTGTFTYVSSDPTIVNVSETGTMIGMKVGTATVTVTLSGGKDADGNPLADIVKVITVTVKRGIASVEGTITVKQNSTVDLSKYEITVTYTDGATEKIALNDSRVQVQDIDTSVIGSSQYNILLTIDGETERKTITVEVTGGGCNCGASLGSGMLFGVLMLAAALVLIGKKKKAN